MYSQYRERDIRASFIPRSFFGALLAFLISLAFAPLVYSWTESVVYRLLANSYSADVIAVLLDVYFVALYPLTAFALYWIGYHASRTAWLKINEALFR